MVRNELKMSLLRAGVMTVAVAAVVSASHLLVPPDSNRVKSRQMDIINTLESSNARLKEVEAAIRSLKAEQQRQQDDLADAVKHRTKTADVRQWD